MFGSTILDVAIGLALVYALLSAIASALRESIEGWTKSCAVHLERGIRLLLAKGKAAGNAPDDPENKLVRALYNHPLVAALYNGTYEEARQTSYFKSKLPFYIPARNVATALLDIVARGGEVKELGAAAPNSSPRRDRSKSRTGSEP